MRWLLPLLCLAACDERLPTIGDDDDSTEPEDTSPDDDDTTDTDPTAPGMLATRSYEATTSEGGIVAVEVDVKDGISSFLITGEAQRYVSLERVTDPAGNVVLHWQDWWTTPESLTNAFFGFDKATGFNWPVRDQDGPLAEGTWTVELSTIDNQGNYAGDTPIELTVQTKADDDLETGVARVHILWADGVDQDPLVVDAIETAVERWREVWGAYGLVLEETYQATTLDPRLGFTYTGSDEVESLAAEMPEGSLVLVVGEQVMNGQSTFGVSGGIPGTLAATPMSFVVLAWRSHAGGDGAFDEDELRLMGETMAHEVGHFTGLFHPVEWNYNLWDALEDTPSCTTGQTCDNQLGENLMYPYPICDFSSCYPQDQLTADQRAVAHQYTGLL